MMIPQKTLLSTPFGNKIARSRIFTKYIYKPQKLCYNRYAKQKQIRFSEDSFSQGDIVPFFTRLLNMAKMQIPQVGWENILIDLFLFGDNWGLRFSVR